MSVHVFGVRHHGPGSARSLVAALRALTPDVVLVEGPVEASEEIRWIADPLLRPPVALLVFRPDMPLSSVFYPFAAFSPEWNALRYALDAKVPARFMDLPWSNWMALEALEGEPEIPREDPLETMAKAAGETDFERLWDRLVESRGDANVFSAIAEAMGAMRAEGGRPMTREDALREAAMRQEIRQAQKEGFQKIAVVCGAWHGPALEKMPTAKEDAALLKGLAKVKVQSTWVPWTHGRLMSASGYGAGIESPGWYEHLWQTPEQTMVRWVSKVAHLLRSEDLDASSAQVIDTVRLAEALATFRGRCQAGLSELNDATETVLLFGNPLPLKLIGTKLIVGERMGEVPPDASAVPIQRDLEAQVKRLRWKLENTRREADLDLRKENDRERSQLLHRLHLLDVPWGNLAHARNQQGTFHEIWEMAWEPEFAVRVIDAARWGNTVEAAAANRARNVAAEAKQLPEITALLEPVLKANLGDAAPAVLRRLGEIAALAPDIAHLMDAIPALANVARYGDVRGTDRELVTNLLHELMARICAGLAVACGSLNDEAAAAMTRHIAATDQAIAPMDDAGLQNPWRETLRRIADLPGVHGLVGGRCARVLFDKGSLDNAELSRRTSQCLSPGTAPLDGAAWLEGFFEKSGGVLIAHRELWDLVDAWIQGLGPEAFENTLPLLRRTFATFHSAERRQLGERVREGSAGAATVVDSGRVDAERGAKALPLIAKILGLEMKA